MSNRQCFVTSSEGIELAIPQSMVDDLVMKVVDEAYDKNMVLSNGTYAKRFQIWTVDGKITIGSELIDTMLLSPEKVDYLLPIVALWEENGNDHAIIILHSEILENPKFMDDPQIVRLVKQAPNVTKDNLLKVLQQKLKG
jgi:hypothetical protein